MWSQQPAPAEEEAEVNDLTMVGGAEDDDHCLA